MNIIKEVLLCFFSVALSMSINRLLFKKYNNYIVCAKNDLVSVCITLILCLIIFIKTGGSNSILGLSGDSGLVHAIIFVTMLGVLSSSFLIDMLYMELPDENNFIIGIIMIFLNRDIITINSVCFSIILFLVFFAISVATNQFGMGDVKMIFFMSLGVSMKTSMLFLYKSFLLASLYCLMLIPLKQIKKRHSISFGPFLILGFVLYVL